MKIQLLTIGKTEEKYIQEGLKIYENRLKHYISFETKELPALKNTSSLSEARQKQEEGEKLLQKTEPTDHLILLDEKGKEFTSRAFAGQLEGLMVQSVRQVIFVVGGPYGFSEAVYKRANNKISLSKMTFPHQLVRLVFIEQLYRAMTILKNEPYHHD